MAALGRSDLGGIYSQLTHGGKNTQWFAVTDYVRLARPTILPS
jgi:hypothetical protein